MRPLWQRIIRLMALLLVAWAVAACVSVAGPDRELDPVAESALDRVPDGAAILEGKVAQAPTRAIPVHLTILHTNDVRGAVDPCG